MKLWFSDGRLLEQGGRVRLLRVARDWLVVGDGYVCQVDSHEAGLQHIEGLKAAARDRGITIEAANKGS